MRPAALLLLCAGCDAVFSIDKVKDLPDAPTCTSPDEDGDKVNNVCDHCPADSDMAQTDTDQDGVGDACDPDPTTPGDHMVVFDGFDDLGTWTMQGGTWQLANGVFMQMQGGADGQLRRMIVATVPTAEVIISDLTPTATGYAGLLASIPTALGPSEFKCYVIKRETDGVELVHMEAFLIGGDMQMPSGTGPLRIQGGQMHDGRVYCKARHEGGVDTQTVTSSPVDPATMDQIGLITGSASATFTSVTLFDVPVM